MDVCREKLVSYQGESGESEEVKSRRPRNKRESETALHCTVCEEFKIGVMEQSKDGGKNNSVNRLKSLYHMGL